MTKKQSPPEVIIEYTDWTRFLPWLTQVAFVLAIALVAARAMMLEVTRETMDTMGAAAHAPRTCGPAGSVMLDLLCCVPMLLVLLRRSVDKEYIVRFSWGTVLFAMLAIWALLSTLWAGDKFQALTQSFHLTAAAALFWTMTQLVRSSARLRIVAGVGMGLLVIFIANGLFYRFAELPDTQQFWKEHRAEEMRARGWEEGDFALQRYDQKVQSGELVGFEGSANSFAAAIVLLGVVVAGAGIQRIVNRDESGLIGAIFLPLPFALWIIYYTQSKAAFLSPIIAAGIFVATGYAGRLVPRNQKRRFWIVVAILVSIAFAVVGHGRYHGTLPTDSLNFRWRYWAASMRLIPAHPLRGVGYGNFGNAYLAVRLPAAAEEVKDPHNLFVRVTTELGLIGAALFTAWLLRAWWEWTRPTSPALQPPKSTTGKAGPRTMMLMLGSISFLTLIIRIFAGVDFFTGNGWWLVSEFLKYLAYSAVLLIGSAVIAVKSTKDMSLDNRPAPWVTAGMLAALAVFLIHNTIDFSFFEIGPMMLFMLIGGAALGVRVPSAVGMHKRTAIAISTFATITIAWLVALIFVAVPLADAANRAYEGDQAYQKGDARLAAEHYQAAYAGAPVKNADYAARAARALMFVPNVDGLVRSYLGYTIDASPSDPFPYLTRARYNFQNHRDNQSSIRADFDHALALNPNDVDTRIEYAKILETFGDKPSTAAEYQAALNLNAALDPAEPKRLPTTRVREIEMKIKQLGNDR